MSQKNDLFLGLSFKAIAIIVVAILFFGSYVGVLLFGENSLMALTKLQNDKRELTHEVRRLKAENEKLQKDFFELKQLEPKNQ